MADAVSAIDSVPGQAQVLLLARMMDVQRLNGAALVAMVSPPPAAATGTPKISATGTDLYL